MIFFDIFCIIIIIIMSIFEKVFFPMIFFLSSLPLETISNCQRVKKEHQALGNLV